MANWSTPKPAEEPGQPVPADSPYTKANGVPPFEWKSTQASKTTGDAAPTLPAHLPLHACMGLNHCAGSDRYGLTGPNGDDPNSCAGQGYCATTADHTCHTKNNCANQGGCGLYGWGPDMNHPGVNECRSMGSCATPINAERFTTSGANKGQSVWVRAREVFEKAWQEKHRAEVAAKVESGAVETPSGTVPEKLGPVPAPFSGTGPSYLWISDDNKNRPAMTSCGSSGLSGAGGCG
ncbi:hypothetical protein [Amylibacter sp. IMCC11727]|uniref:hypothetical protein n=1 Tax=Amylibacter sp. IMCC11727 TaxID=3039851 RepID=UPI00244DBE48|nr:hypothetical protein [Amylibacter sp. IMCC11727]WGI23266.1 hypothetical protein QBD29_07530 [Amylibacter sp. IMCC11727]